MANAGIDQSNVADPANGESALLLPEDPDASAARLREQLHALDRLRAGRCDQRQLRPALANGHRGRGDRLRGSFRNARFARREGHVRPHLCA